MNDYLLWLPGVVSLLFVVACVCIHELGYKRGFRAGRIACDNWWMGVESKVEEERHKMWAKELHQ